MTATTHRSETEAPRHSCSCGCRECRPECCTLECLERPRFFGGQVLNERDLNALVEWIRGKSALARYRHGWGVVCGLDVTAASAAGQVDVSPGYGIACCGDDVVLCRPATFDFCAEVRPQPGDCDPPSEGQPRANDLFSLGEARVMDQDVFAFDLYASYDGTLADAQPAISRNACGVSSECEYTRIREGARLCARRVKGCETPEPWKKIEEDYRRFLAELPDVPANREEWKKQARKWTPHRHVYLNTWIAKSARDEDWGTVQDRLILDRLESYFAAACFSCDESWGIPLARVWVHRMAGGKCEILRIAAAPPFRRPVSHGAWPAKPGTVHLGQFVGRTVPDVKCALAGRGILAMPVEWSLPLLAEAEVYADCPGEVTALYYQDECGDQRVVAFLPWIAQHPEPEPQPDPPPDPPQDTSHPPVILALHGEAAPEPEIEGSPEEPAQQRTKGRGRARDKA